MAAPANSALQTLLAMPSFGTHSALLSELPPPAAEPASEFETVELRNAFSHQLQLIYKQLLAVPVDDVSHLAYRVRPIARIEVDGQKVFYLRQPESQGGQLAVNPVEERREWREQNIAFMSRWHRFYCAMNNIALGPLGYANMQRDRALLMEGLPN